MAVISVVAAAAAAVPEETGKTPRAKVPLASLRIVGLLKGQLLGGAGLGASVQVHRRSSQRTSGLCMAQWGSVSSTKPGPTSL